MDINYHGTELDTLYSADINMNLYIFLSFF